MIIGKKRCSQYNLGIRQSVKTKEGRAEIYNSGLLGLHFYTFMTKEDSFVKKSIVWILIVAMLIGMIPTAFAADKTTVTFWAIDHGDIRNNFIQGLVDAYNAQPDCAYQVELTFSDEGSYRDRLSAARAGGTMCDIYMNNYGNIPTDCNNEYALALDDLLPAEVISDLYEDSKKLVTYRDGKMYGYPMFVEPCTVAYYNKEMFAEAGITEFPKTYDEFLEAAKKLTNEFVYGAHFVEGVWDVSYNQQQGHYLLNDTWTEANCQDQGYIDLYDFIRQLYADGSAPAQSLYGQAEAWRAVCDEACAIAFSGSWAVTNMLQDYPDMIDKIGLATFPSKDGSTWHTTTGGWAWLIDAKSPNAKGAADFIAYSIGGDAERMAQLYIDLNFSTYSPRASVGAVLDAYAAEHQGEFAVECMQFISKNIVPFCVPEPTYSVELTVKSWIGLQQVMWNGMTAEEALAWVANEINTYLTTNEYWKFCP